MGDTATFTLKMIDRLSAPAGKARRSVSKLDRELMRSAKIADKFTDKSGRMRAGNGRFLGSGSKGGRSSGRGGGWLDVLKGNLMTSAVFKTAELGKDIAAAGAEFITFGQNAKFGFQQLAKHGATVDSLFSHSRELAKRLGLDVQDTTEQYQDLLRLQFNPGEIDRLVKMTADLNAGPGADPEKAQGILTALGQIKSKGKIQAEEMMQLAERGVSMGLVWDAIGKRMGGKTKAQVQKLQQKGQISSEVGLAAIEDAIKTKLQEKNLGDVGMKFADSTITGMVGRIKAITEDMGLSLVDRVIEPATRIFSRTLSRFETFIQSDEGNKFVDRLSVSLGNAVSAVDKFLGKDFSGATVSKMFDELGTALTPAAESMGRVLGRGIWQGLLDGLSGTGGSATNDQAAKALGNIQSRLDRFGGLGASTLTDKQLAALKSQSRSNSDIIGGLFTDAKSALFGLGKNSSEGFSKGMATGARGIGKNSLADPVIDSTASALRIHSPSRVFERLGLQTSLGFALGVDRGGARVGAAFGDIGLGPAISSSSMAPPELEPAAMTSSRIGGPISVSVDVHVNGGGDPEATGRAAGREVRRELDAFFRQLSAEGG